MGLGRRDCFLSFAPALLFFRTRASLLASVCFFILFRSCCSHARVLGERSCMSSTFPVAVLSGTFFFFELWRQWKIGNWALLNKSYHHYFIFVIPYRRLDLTLLSRHVLPNTIIYWYDCLPPKYYCLFYCLCSWIRKFCRISYILPEKQRIYFYKGNCSDFFVLCFISVMCVIVTAIKN